MSNLDAFDVMICIPAGRVNIQPFGEPGACCSVSSPQGNKRLREFLVEGSNIVSGYNMLHKFREEVIKSLRRVAGGCQDDSFGFLGVKLHYLGSDWNSLLASIFFLPSQSGTCKERRKGALQWPSKPPRHLSFHWMLSSVSRCIQSGQMLPMMAFQYRGGWEPEIDRASTGSHIILCQSIRA